MYLRFVIHRQDPDSGFLQGVIHAANFLHERDALAPWEEDWLQRDFEWLNEHLPVPRVLRHHESRRALSWFRPTAHKEIACVRSIVALLREHAIPVRQLTTRDPGLVVYRDDYQVVAKPPHRRTGRRARPRQSSVTGTTGANWTWPPAIRAPTKSNA